MDSQIDKIILSENCREFRQGNVNIRVEISRYGDNPKWHLQTDAATTTTTTQVWPELFDTEDEALAEFARTLADEGFDGFVGPRKHKIVDISASKHRS